MDKNSKIYVAGDTGLVGSAIIRLLKFQGYTNVITSSRTIYGRLDLTCERSVRWFFSSYEPEYVFLCAARVGGIAANSAHGVEFFRDNLRIQDNVISMAAEYKAKKLLFLSSACAYPKYADNPITEEALLTGPLELSNRPYALAKIAGVILCQAYRQQYGHDFITAVPTNLYGIGDHYDLENSHVLPGMIRRIHEAKIAGEPCVTLWGTGTPGREFLHSDDLALACLTLMERYSDASPVNISSGHCIALSELAGIVAREIGYSGQIVWDSSRPDGTPWRQLDCRRMQSLGWKPTMLLAAGIAAAYKDFLATRH